MSENKVYLGIDFGGSSVKLGVIDEAGALFGKTQLSVGSLMAGNACRAFAKDVAGFVESAGINPNELSGIGLAIPGAGIGGNRNTPNVSVDWPLFISCIESSFEGRAVAALNDANAAALGEVWLGAGAGAHCAIMVTLGSGLGAGVIVSGSVLVGKHGAAGELGHVNVQRDGRLCNCGRRGCLEQYASGRGLVQSYREAAKSSAQSLHAVKPVALKDDTDALSVFEALAHNDPFARCAVNRMVETLGFGLAQVCCMVDPEVILLGGGISKAAPLFIDDLRKRFNECCFGQCATTEIRVAKLGSDAGIFGAARWAALERKACGRK